MRTLTAAIALLAICSCSDPPLEVELDAGGADATVDSRATDALSCGPVRVDTWVRFWRDGVELPCAQVVAEGYRLEAGVLGDGYTLTVQRGWCSTVINPDPHRRFTTGVFTVTDAPAGKGIGVRATGPGDSVEHVLLTTACGATGSQALSIVLPRSGG